MSTGEKLSVEIYKAIYTALTPEQRIEWNRWRDALSILSSDANHDLSFYCDWLRNEKVFMTPLERGSSAVHELNHMVADILTFDGELLEAR